MRGTLQASMLLIWPGLLSVLALASTSREESVYNDLQKSRCYIHHLDGNGIFKSPNYPKYYDDNTYCMYTFQAKEGEVIELTFDDFHLEFENNCTYDNLTIYDSSGQNAAKTFCGRNITKVVRSSGQFLYLVFRSDWIGSGKGFMGKYKSVKEVYPPGCDVDHTDGNGIFKSPNYPKHYDNNMECIMSFKANDGEVIELTMDDFELEDQTICFYDYVNIYDGKILDPKTPILGTFCGTNKPKQVRSSGQFLSMTFHSDWLVTKRGFKGNYKSVKKDDKPNITPAPSQDPLTSTPLTTSVETSEANITPAPSQDPLTSTPLPTTVETPEEKPKCGQTASDKIKRIVGGNDTIIEKHPWQVYLSTFRYGKHWMCGGAIIAKNWVLTAAHCTEGVAGVWDIKVAAGITNKYDRWYNQYSVKKLIQHDGYHDNLLLNDIALIEIDGVFNLTKDTSRAVCLADESDTTTFDGEKCIATGWGDTSQGGEGSVNLQEAYVNVANNTECLRLDELNNKNYFDLVDETHLCAGHMPGGIDTCQGDSGGPLVCSRPDGTKVVAGVVSSGYACARKNHYSFYTRVSYYAKWISDNMKL